MPNDDLKLSMKRRIIGALIFIGAFVFYAWLDQNPLFKPTPAVTATAAYELVNLEDATRFEQCFNPKRDYLNTELNRFCKGTAHYEQASLTK